MSNMPENTDYKPLLQRSLLALKEMQTRVEHLEQERTEPIAIIGIGCRFPGGANDPESFWHLLREGKDVVTEIPADRWDIDAYYDPDPDTPGKMSTRWGSFLENIDTFDADFFGIAPREAISMDPQHRLLLEVSWEALERAGQPLEKLSKSLTGIFVGVYSNDYAMLQFADPAAISSYTGTGTSHNTLAGRLSYQLDLRGPNVAVDTACSSSLVAVHLACQSLRTRECDMALAAGVNLILSPQFLIATSKMHMMAADGRCKTFDARANGIVLGEGCGVVVLKRLSDALADGDPILALIRGSAVNQDGHSTGLTAPNLLAQQEVLRQALASARVAPEQIGYVETHGTGTVLGDPIEVEALSAVIGQPRSQDSRCFLGSVKTNVGHLGAAAGIAGLIKTVLMFQHEEIPPHLHFRDLNPHITFERTPFVLPTQCTPWKGDGQRYAGVSSFGWSGTNAHVVLQEPPLASSVPSSTSLPPALTSEAASSLSLFPLSARSPQALLSLAHASLAFLQTHPSSSLPDLCFSASLKRSHFEYRRALLASSLPELTHSLQSFLAQPPSPLPAISSPLPRLVFVFSGQGGQWPGMARELLACEPVFRAELQRCSSLLAHLVPWSPLDLLSSEHDASLLEHTSYAQPLLVCLQVALTALWRSWGLSPTAVLGHSVGEIAAAHVAGILSLEQALLLPVRRGQLMEQTHGQGAMLAVGLAPSRLSQFLGDLLPQLDLAALNGPESCVLAGSPSLIERAHHLLSAQRLFCRRLASPYAFHSRQMDPLVSSLLAQLSDLTPQPGQLCFYSTVTADLLEGTALTAPYWGRNLREPVAFAATLSTVLEQGPARLDEIGPHPALGTAMQQVALAQGQDALIVGSLRRGESQRRTLLESLAACYERGYALNWAALQPAPARLLSLPTYPWQRQRYWLEARHQSSPVTTSASASRWLSWLYEVQWVQASRIEQNLTRDALAGRWLIFADQQNIGKELASSLQAHGAECVLVPIPSDPSVLDDLHACSHWFATHLQISKADRTDPAPWQGIVYLWGLDLPATADLTLEDLQQVQTRWWGSALALIQTLQQSEIAGESGHPRPRVWLVTKGSQFLPPASSASGTTLAIAQAPLWSLGRVFALEQPALWGGLIDLDPQMSTTDAALTLIRELATTNGEDHIAWRGNNRFVARLHHSAVPLAQEQLSAFRPVADGCYLITGGLGALGLNLANWLVKHGARHLVLLGRSGASSIQPGSKQEQMLAALEQTDAKIDIISTDVSNYEQMAALFAHLKQLEHPLRGIFHLAGVAHLQPSMQIDSKSWRSGLQAKVTGAWLLHQFSLDLDLDCCVFFSSAAATWGMKESAAYATANAFLDILAYYRQTQGKPACSIGWTPWIGEGMTESKVHGGFASMGIASLEPATALDVLAYILTRKQPQQVVAQADWETFIPIYNARRWRPLLEDLARTRASESSLSTSAQQHTALRQRLEQATKDQQHRLLLEVLQEHVQQVLGRTGEQPLAIHQAFFEAGMDSLMAVDLQKHLQKSLGCTFPTTVIFDYPTIESLVDYLAHHILKLNGSSPAQLPSRARASASTESAQPEAIAIIGIGCRFPGGANDPESFWRLLQEGRDAVTEVPADRWDIDAYYDPDPDTPGKMSTRWGSFLEHVDLFDAAFFNITPREAISMDPQHRLLLEVSWEALEHAGVVPKDLAGFPMGVFVGLTTTDYAHLLQQADSSQIDAYYATGNTLNAAPGRLSYSLGLRGPAVAVDTACSSSLVAVHLACQSLRTRECDMALAAGVNLILSPTFTINLSKMHMMAADGRCKTFDARANGIVLGEGCGVVVLKRLSDALADGDPILALIRGSAVNQDGHSTGLTAPNLLAQQEVLRQALASARVAPEQIGYVETHGTGTVLGDPIEVEALSAVIGQPRSQDSRCFLGSVKTNVGHLGAAAGIAGLIKVVLSLQHEELPPHLHLKKVNPRITLDAIPAEIPTRVISWQRGTEPRIAGVSSFGVSGTNAHVVLQEPPLASSVPSSTSLPPALTSEAASSLSLFPLSARSPQALLSLAHASLAFLQTHPSSSLPDLCFSASLKRSHFEYRRALLASSLPELTHSLQSFLAQPPSPLPAISSPLPRLVFLFSGQGGHWPGIARELLACEPVFRAELQRCSSLLAQLVPWSPLDLLSSEQDASLLEHTSYAQPLLVCLQVALTALWRSWGLSPTAVLGHSVGEIAAAHVAGILSLEQALLLAVALPPAPPPRPSNATPAWAGTSAPSRPPPPPPPPFPRRPPSSAGLAS